MNLKTSVNLILGMFSTEKALYWVHLNPSTSRRVSPLSLSTQEFYSWDGLGILSDRNILDKKKNLVFHKRGGVKRKERKRAVNIQHISDSVLLVTNCTVFKLLIQAFPFYAQFFKDSIGNGQLWPINDFLNRHLGITVKSFFLNHVFTVPPPKKTEA